MADSMTPSWRKDQPLARPRARSANRKLILADNFALRKVKPVSKTHLIVLDEAQALINPATVVGGVKQKAIKTLRAGPGDEAFHQKRGETASSPIRFGKHIDNDGMTTLGDDDLAVRFADGMRKDAPEL